MTNLSRIFLLSISFVIACIITTQPCSAQRRQRKKDDTTIKGKVTLDRRYKRSWNGDNLSVDLTKITGKLREYVVLPPPKYPAGYKKWTPQQLVEWQDKFAATDAGKKVIERNQKLLDAANSFDIQVERDGSFVVYDVPAGEYAIQGRYDRAIGDLNYAYEIFGKLTVDKDVDNMTLAPIQIEVTPQYQRGMPAPPFKVTDYNDKNKLELPMFKGKLLMINFWSAASPVAAKEQAAVQATIDKIEAKHKFRVLSINVDKDRIKALKLLSENKLLKGSHGFTLGLNNPSLFNYGIRGVPSYWLIDAEGNVLINQYEFAKMMRTKDSIEAVIMDRLKNNQAPVPAVRPANKKKAPVPAVRPAKEKN